MANVKIAVIGAGSYVFGSSMLSQAVLDHRLDGIELALMDVDAEVLELMAGVGKRMARESGVNTVITSHTVRETALTGADFVTCSAARQMFRRFAMDGEIIDRVSPGHQVSEFGGVAGIAYSLRQIALIEEITADMRRLCPSAWLLDSANPLPRVCQAAHTLGVKTAGFCAVSLSGYGAIQRLLTGAFEQYPWDDARRRWDVTMGGLNHFSWIVAVKDRHTGVDAMPDIRRALAEEKSTGQPVADRLARETGYMLSAGDDHTKDFLAPSGVASHRGSAGHGNPDERAQRIAYLRAICEGRETWDELLTHGAWERPLDMIAAMVTGNEAHLHALNLANGGQISNLPHGVFVETPAVVASAGPKAATVVLPETLVHYCERTARVTDTIVRAGLERSRKLVHEAVELDPTVLDKAAGCAAIDACMHAHGDILPAYA